MKQTWKNLAILFLCLLVWAPAVQAQQEKKAEEKPYKLKNTLLWRISGNGAQNASYLYGTVHMADDMAYRLADSVLLAFRKCDIYAMEINMDSFNRGGAMASMQLEDRKTLKDVMTDSQYTVADSFFSAKMGVSLAYMNRMKPILIYLMGELTDTELERQKAMSSSDERPVLDLFFFKLAKQEKKKVTGLEQVRDQIKLLVEIPLEEQINLLMNSIRTQNEMAGAADSEEEHTIMEAYGKSDITAIYEISKADTTLGNDFFDKFITKRNIHMANGAHSLIQQNSGKVFIAVGAAHLGGREGIIYLLREKGYSVEPVVSKRRLDPDKVAAELKKEKDE